MKRSQKCNSIIKNREEELIGHIDQLERKLSQTTYSQPQQVKLETELQSLSSPAVSVKQGFDIDEVVVAHPEIRSQDKTTIRRQEDYIKFLTKLLYQVLDETFFMFNTSLASYKTENKFKENILSELYNYQTYINESERDEVPSPLQSYENRNGNNPTEYIKKTHTDIISKFQNLENFHKTQSQYKGSSHLVQDMVEDFILVANKQKDTETATKQLEIMKLTHERNPSIFQSIFGIDFIARMKSRIDIRTFKPKEVEDPEPEIPDDLEISNDSESIKFTLPRESEYKSKHIITHEQAVQTESEPKLQRK